MHNPLLLGSKRLANGKVAATEVICCSAAFWAVLASACLEILKRIGSARGSLCLTATESKWQASAISCHAALHTDGATPCLLLLDGMPSLLDLASLRHAPRRLTLGSLRNGKCMIGCALRSRALSGAPPPADISGTMSFRCRRDMVAAQWRC